MLVIRVRECSTRHHVLREVLGYHASTVRKLLMDAGHTRTHTHTHIYRRDTIRKINLALYSSKSHVVKKQRQCGGVLTMVQWDGGHSAGVEQEDV